MLGLFSCLTCHTEKFTWSGIKLLHGGSGASQGALWRFSEARFETTFSCEQVFDPAPDGYFCIGTNTGMKAGWQLTDGTWHYFTPVSDRKKGIMLTEA